MIVGKENSLLFLPQEECYHVDTGKGDPFSGDMVKGVEFETFTHFQREAVTNHFCDLNSTPTHSLVQE